MEHGSLASEQAFLSLIDRHFPNAHDHMSVGRGDDCARLCCPPAMVLSTDLFLEDVHFRRSYFSPADIGYKALAVNASDIAGMGCRPLGFSLGLMIPNDAGLSEPYWDELFAGMAELASSLDLPLTGGDLSSAPILGFSLCIWGEPGESGRILERQKCQDKDALILCASPGLARVGLMALEAFGPEAMAEYPEACAAHLRPRPLVAEGLILARDEDVHGAMDVSDGLARDLPRFLGPNLGADLRFPPRAIHPEVLRWCIHAGQDPATFCFEGGEDYGLLVCAPQQQAPVVAAAVPSACIIGNIRPGCDITVNDRPANVSGFDHFANKDGN